MRPVKAFPALNAMPYLQLTDVPHCFFCFGSQSAEGVEYNQQDKAERTSEQSHDAQKSEIRVGKQNRISLDTEMVARTLECATFLGNVETKVTTGIVVWKETKTYSEVKCNAGNCFTFGCISHVGQTEHTFLCHQALFFC